MENAYLDDYFNASCIFEIKNKKIYEVKILQHSELQHYESDHTAATRRLNTMFSFVTFGFILGGKCN